jgi:hypothetical protein
LLLPLLLLLLLLPCASTEFKCGIAFDPWWPLLPSNSAALKGWQTNGPLLVLGSQVGHSNPSWLDVVTASLHLVGSVPARGCRGSNSMLLCLTGTQN